MKMIRVVLQGGIVFEAPGREQLFSFSPNDSDERLMICVPKLVELLQESPDLWETIGIPVTAEDTDLLIRTRGIEMDHVGKMSPERAGEPGLAIFLADGSFLVVDGNHRYVRRSALGLKWMAFHTCRDDTWRAALVDIPATQRLIQKGTVR